MPESVFVFDTVSLSNFLLSDAVFILESRYRSSGVITWEVYCEISAGVMEYLELSRVDALIDDEIFNLVHLPLTARKVFLELIGFLGKGEASCLACAKIQSSVVVTDDRAARKQCLQMNIPVTGTVGILKASVLDSHISLSLADKILNSMISTGFYSPVRSISDIV